MYANRAKQIEYVVVVFSVRVPWKICRSLTEAEAVGHASKIWILLPTKYIN